MDHRLREIQQKVVEQKHTATFNAGDTITVAYKIKEGNKERIQQFQGVVIQKRGTGSNQTFTMRKISGGVGVERIFPISSPFLETITVQKKGKVRRARIFYLRTLKGKAARIKERIMAKA